MSDQPSSNNTRSWGHDDPLEQIREILWGGPQGRGLVYMVESLARTAEKHSRALYGDNGNPGIQHKVSLHGDFIEGFRDSQKWALRLLAAQLLAIILAGGAIVAKVAFGG